MSQPLESASKPKDMGGMKPGRLGTSNGWPSIEWWRPGQAALGEPSTVTRVVEYESEEVRDRIAADALGAEERVAAPEEDGSAEAADAEYHLLLREAQDACARRMAASTSIGSSDSALRDLNFRVRRLNAMSQEQLLASARRREEAPLPPSRDASSGEAPADRPRGQG